MTGGSSAELVECEKCRKHGLFEWDNRYYCDDCIGKALDEYMDDICTRASLARSNKNKVLGVQANDGT